MSAVPQSIIDQSPRSLRNKDRRRHRRIIVRISGRFLNEISEDKPLQTRDISCSGAMIDSEHKPPVGARIVCYLDQLGRVAATVIRHTETGFAVNFQTTQTKRDRIADKLTWIINKGPLDLNDERRASRFAAGGPAIVRRESGRDLQCRAVDISLTGAGFKTDGPMPVIGETVKVGNLYGTVVRSAEQFFAIRYLTKQEIEDR